MKQHKQNKIKQSNKKPTIVQGNIGESIPEVQINAQ